MSAIQAQWSLDQSAQSVIGVARRVLQAATTDNVRPLAILACERFGATLAMSRDACIKMERDVVPAPEPVIIGYSLLLPLLL